MIGFDFDGVISKVQRPKFLPNWFLNFSLFFFRWILLFSPEKKEVTEIMKKMSQKCDIVVISCRPKFCENITRKWLVKKGVPFSEIYCIGLGNSKTSLLKEKSVCLFIDDEKYHIEEAVSGGFDAVIIEDFV